MLASLPHVGEFVVPEPAKSQCLTNVINLCKASGKSKQSVSSLGKWGCSVRSPVAPNHLTIWCLPWRHLIQIGRCGGSPWEGVKCLYRALSPPEKSESSSSKIWSRLHDKVLWSDIVIRLSYVCPLAFFRLQKMAAGNLVRGNQRNG